MQFVAPDFKDVHVVQHAVDGDAGVEKEWILFILLVRRHQHRYAVLGAQLRLGERISVALEPPRDGSAAHQHVDGIIHDAENLDPIDGF